jgi:drug/metabolite transporter (DMT)-like permease
MLGLIAATAAAMLWAVATVLYARAGRVISPIRLNAIKGVGVSLLFASILLIFQRSDLVDLQHVPAAVVVGLAISGIVGIALGDSFYFASVNRIGPGRVSLLFLTSIPMTVVGGVIFLGETLSPLQILGVVITIAGVSWVVAERTELKPLPLESVSSALHRRSEYVAGVCFGVLAAVGQAAGAVVNRQVLSETDLSSLQTALLRLGSATVVLVPIALLLGGRRRSNGGTTVFVPAKIWLTVAVAALLGTFGGIWLQQVAFDRADAGIAATLLSTTPIWILPIAWLAGERVTRRTVVGALVAMLGIGLLVSGTTID